MGNLAFVGSHTINGVSALHTELMRKTVFQSLNAVYPDRINNKTNGITFRRWLIECNPGLTELIRATIGERALDDIDALKGSRRLRRRSVDAGARRRRRGAPTRSRFAVMSPTSSASASIPRRCSTSRSSASTNTSASCSTFSRRSRSTTRSAPIRASTGRRGSRSSPARRRASYTQAKLIIKLANDVAKVINSDPTVRGLLKVVFLPNYNVILAEIIMPAADLSEQISTAGMEASGTGNMKIALNGALTIGTLDGANVEMRELVGDDNIFIFGLTAAEVEARARQGHRRDRAHRRLPGAARGARRDLLRRVLAGRAGRYRDLVDALTHHDWFMVCADFDAYWRRRRRSTRPGATAGAGCARASATPPTSAGSPPTARSPNMPKKSGTCRSRR